MGEDGEDWNRLEVMISKNLGYFLKITERWHSSFKWLFHVQYETKYLELIFHHFLFVVTNM